MKNIFTTHFKVFLKKKIRMKARSIRPHMNPLHPHGNHKKIRTYKWKTSNTMMSRTFYNYRKNEGGFIPPRFRYSFQNIDGHTNSLCRGCEFFCDCDNGYARFWGQCVFPFLEYHASVCRLLDIICPNEISCFGNAGRMTASKFVPIVLHGVPPFL